MDRKHMNRTRAFALFFVALWFGGMLAMIGGCSTVSGGAALMRGIAQDVEDFAEGARQRMAE